MTVNNQSICVYITTKNRLECLKTAIASVLAQTYDNFELVIIVDGSTDGSKEYVKELKDSGIRLRYYFNKVSKGACYSRNQAINSTECFYITGLDDDDSFSKNRLETFIENYDSNYSFICSGFWWNDGKSKKIVNGKPKIFGLHQMLDYNEASNQVFTEVSRLRAVGGFDETFVACQDYDTWVRLVEMFGRAKRISGASYLVNAKENESRITNPLNWLKGHQQYMDKHIKKMSIRNIKNQEFKVLTVKRQPLSLIDFIKSIRFGLVGSKFRYLISSRVRMLAKKI